MRTCRRDAPTNMKRKAMCKHVSFQGSQAWTMKPWSDAVHSRRKCANIPKDPSSRYPPSILRTNGTGIPNYTVSHPATLLPCLFGTCVLIRREQHQHSFESSCTSTATKQVFKLWFRRTSPEILNLSEILIRRHPISLERDRKIETTNTLVCLWVNGQLDAQSRYIQVGAKRTHFFFIYLPAISFFGVTSNQKSTFENLVQSTIWKFPFAKKLQLCHKKC